MERYVVPITEYRVINVEVFADSKDEAFEKALDMYESDNLDFNNPNTIEDVMIGTEEDW